VLLLLLLLPRVLWQKLHALLRLLCQLGLLLLLLLPVQAAAPAVAVPKAAPPAPESSNRRRRAWAGR